MKEIDLDILEEFASTLEHLTCGDYKGNTFEKYMRVGNPNIIR